MSTTGVRSEDATGDAVVGTASGALTLYGANLHVTAVNGNAQLGYHGAGSGNIAITMTGDVIASAGKPRWQPCRVPCGGADCHRRSSRWCVNFRGICQGWP